MHYSFARSAQTRSRLMMLPLELRLQILHYLHRDTATFKTLQLPDDAAPKIHGLPDTQMNPSALQLSGQIVRTCQQLHEEYCKILYEESIILQHRCEDIRTYMPDFQFATFAFSLVTVIKQMRPSLSNDIDSILEGSHWSICSSVCNGSKDQKDDFSKALNPYVSNLKRMKYIKATIVYACPMDVYISCRILNSLFKGANLSLRLEYANLDWFDGVAPPTIDTVLRSCTSLRCKSLEFLNLPESVLTSKAATELKQTVESTDPYNDLFDEWNFFINHIRDVPYLLYRAARYELLCDDDEFRDHADALEDAVAVSDARDFQAHLTALKLYVKEFVMETSRKKNDEESGKVGRETDDFFEGLGV